MPRRWPKPDKRRLDATGRGKVSGTHTIFSMIFGRMDLRMDVSGAKFGAEADFEVSLDEAPPKPNKNLIFWAEIAS